MPTSIQNVRGIGPSTAEFLAEHNIVTAEDLAACKVAQVAAIKGFSDIRAKQVINDAKALFDDAQPTPDKKKKPGKKTVEKKVKKAKEKKAAKTKKDKKSDKTDKKKDKKSKDKSKKSKSKKGQGKESS
eukprot:Anaeramoba_flamelloidesc84817_g1_i1.p1 GENE.c84817_g1_i1~~c84817_g1_i1.p1  ORF type:complete len:129 (+),score=38.36 c84817_g1_i1:288-674(+)